MKTSMYSFLPLLSLAHAAVGDDGLSPEVCVGVQPQATNVGPNCWAQLWQAAGCKPETLPAYEQWHSLQTLEILISDVQQWATLDDARHRRGCYGVEIVEAPAPEAAAPQAGGQAASSAVYHFTSALELSQALQAASPTVPIVFQLSSRSCGFCVIMTPVFELVAEKYSKIGAIFASVDVELIPEAADLFQVQGLPAFRTLLRGTLFSAVDGADTEGLGRMVQTACQAAGLDPTLAEGAAGGAVERAGVASPSSTADTAVGGLSDQQLVSQLEALRRELRTRAARQEVWSGQSIASGVAPALDIKMALYTSQHEVDGLLANPGASADSQCPGLGSAPGVAQHRARVVVVGGGPAGLAAALYAARAGLCPVLVAPRAGKAGGQLLAQGVDVENYPGLERTTGAAMVGDMRSQVLAFGVELVDALVTKIDTERRPFELRLTSDTASGDGGVEATEDATEMAGAASEAAISADAVIFATGASTRWLHVPGEQQLRGRGVSSCAACDGFLFRGRKCAVVGGGDAAVEEALFLSRICAPPVLLFHRRGSLRAGHYLQKRLFALQGLGQVEIVWHTEVEEFVEEVSREEGARPKLAGVRVANTASTSDPAEVYSVDAVFVAIGHDPNTVLLRGQAETMGGDQQGYLKVGYSDPLGGHFSTQTSISGVFAAGDVADPHYRQAITSAGSGAKAAMDAERWLMSASIA